VETEPVNFRTVTQSVECDSIRCWKYRRFPPAGNLANHRFRPPFRSADREV